jgi:hypothetical protein
MKYIFTFLFCLIFSASTSFAQLSDTMLNKAVESYLTSLDYSNPGVVEGAIENVMVLKLYYPDKDYSKIIQKLDELTHVNNPKSIRVKAFIAANYLKNPNFIEPDYSKYHQEYNLIRRNEQRESIKHQLNKVAIRKLLNSVEFVWREN